MKKVSIIVSAGVTSIVLFSFAPLVVNAQTVTTPYLCGGYYSSLPCDYGGNYNYNYNYNYGYNPNYYYSPTPYYYSYPSYAYTYPRPSCTITISNAYTNYYGYYSQPATLSWSSSNATSAYISNVGAVATYGSMTVYPYGQMTYMMTVSGPGGTNTCQTTYYQSYQYSQPYYYQQHYYHQYPQYNYYGQYPYYGGYYYGY